MIISKIDRKILHELQSNSRQSSAAIGEKVGLSASACHRRIGLLEERGLIETYTARLNGTALGFAMTFYVELPHVSRIQSSLVMKTVKRWTGYPAL